MTPYRWTGVMPAGLVIDSFTGETSGTPTSEAGSITFPVELCDQDPTSARETRRLARWGLTNTGLPTGANLRAESGREPGECRICIPEGKDPP